MLSSPKTEGKHWSQEVDTALQILSVLEEERGQEGQGRGEDRGEGGGEEREWEGREGQEGRIFFPLHPQQGPASFHWTHLYIRPVNWGLRKNVHCNENDCPQHLLNSYLPGAFPRFFLHKSCLTSDSHWHKRKVYFLNNSLSSDESTGR